MPVHKKKPDDRWLIDVESDDVEYESARALRGDAHGQ